MTVLFADLVGFTAAAERLGEEGTFAFIRPIHVLMAEAVRDNGGSIKDFTGDGIMAVFGMPLALEDAPLRACRAGLAIVQRLAAAAPAYHRDLGVHVAVRVGINTGIAVATEDGFGTSAFAVVGDVVNVAARLQALAEPGSVVLGESTYRQVRGLVEIGLSEQRAVRGKAQPQTTYRLKEVLVGASRFGAELSRGLSDYVGRQKEIEALETALEAAQCRLQVVDVEADPGMGKSRLLYEFRTRLTKAGIVVLSAACSADGAGTPFLPFIEFVRESFAVRPGEAEIDVLRKLSVGLMALGLESDENLALLLNLLGLVIPQGSLAGLDGVLVGLRTRDLLEQLLLVRASLSPIVLLIEDVHWIDGVSQDLLCKVAQHAEDIPLLLVNTRRPGRAPAWGVVPGMTQLRLAPLSDADIDHLACARLGISTLPRSLERLLSHKAEGNALFAEELLTYLVERGALKIVDGEAGFNAALVATSLPDGLHSLLAARIGSLSTAHRSLLQAASVIGRQFDLDLLSAVFSHETDIARLIAEMASNDLVYLEGGGGTFMFKHALVCDALYESLLTQQRIDLHLLIADEIEHRSKHRLPEMVESLAHHYSKANCPGKAFTYHAMAAAKSLQVYSLEESESHCVAALELLELHAQCATDEQVGDLLVNYTLGLNLSLQPRKIIAVVQAFRQRIAYLRQDRPRVLIQHHYVLALLWSARFREAEIAQRELMAMAEAHEDRDLKSYALASALHLSTFVKPLSIAQFSDMLSQTPVLKADSEGPGPYLENFILAAWGWDELNRGRMAEARKAATQLMEAGQRLNDPRSMGYALCLLAWIALTSDDYQDALELAERSMDMARAPFELVVAKIVWHAALVLLRLPAALEKLRDFMAECERNGWISHCGGADGAYGVALAMDGKIGAGIQWLKRAIHLHQNGGYGANADWCRMFLAELYLEVVSGNQSPSLRLVLRNFFTLVVIRISYRRRIIALIEKVRLRSQFDTAGHHYARCEMILGELHIVTRHEGLAAKHLAEARKLAFGFGHSAMLVRIDRGLARIGAVSNG